MDGPPGTGGGWGEASDALAGVGGASDALAGVA